MFKQNKQAFTLIELLVVVLIIGILAAVAVPQYKVAVAKSRYATLKHIVKSIAQAQETYYLANNTYAGNFENLDIMPPGGGELDPDTLRKYSYDWGYCAMLISSGAGVACFCHDNLANTRYSIYFQHANSEYAGMQRCTVVDITDPIANTICKQDSKLAQPTYTNETSGVAHYFW